MTQNQINQLIEAWNYCDDEDKSTEFMLAYMADSAGVDYDDVVTWITSKKAEQQRDAYNKKHYGNKSKS